MSLFELGTILYLSPFYFNNGAASKNKYFIILKEIDSSIIIASLPTRSNKAPSLIYTTHGCNDEPERLFNCFVFEANRTICTNGFAFPIQTFIYGNEVEDYSLEKLTLSHRIEGVDYDIMGKLYADEYEEIIACLKKSASIRRGVKKYL